MFEEILQKRRKRAFSSEPQRCSPSCDSRWLSRRPLGAPPPRGAWMRSSQGRRLRPGPPVFSRGLHYGLVKAIFRKNNRGNFRICCHNRRAKNKVSTNRLRN